MITPVTIFLAVIALAIAVGLILQWRDNRRARRNFERRLADLIGRKP